MHYCRRSGYLNFILFVWQDKRRNKIKHQRMTFLYMTRGRPCSLPYSTWPRKCHVERTKRRQIVGTRRGSFEQKMRNERAGVEKQKNWISGFDLSAVVLGDFIVKNTVIYILYPLVYGLLYVIDYMSNHLFGICKISMFQFVKLFNTKTLNAASVCCNKFETTFFL